MSFYICQYNLHVGLKQTIYMEVSVPLAWLIYIGKLIKYRQDISVLGSFLLILLSYTLSETDYSDGRFYYFLLSDEL